MSTTTANIALDVFGIVLRVVATINCLLAGMGYAWFADVYSQQPVVSLLVFSPDVFTFLCALLPSAFAVNHYKLTLAIHAIAMISAISKSVASVLGTISPNDESASIMVIILMLFVHYTIRWRWHEKLKDTTAQAG